MWEGKVRSQIQLMLTLKWGDFAELSIWTQHHHKGSYGWERDTGQSELEIKRCCTIFSEDGGKDQEPRSRGSFQELGKMREEDSPLEATERTYPCWCLDISPGAHWKSPWCWKRLKAEGEEGTRGWDSWMASPMQWTWSWANFRRWRGTEAWSAAVHGVAENRTRLGDLNNSPVKPISDSDHQKGKMINSCFFQALLFVEMCYTTFTQMN